MSGGQWSYDPAQLSTSVKDQIRLLIGDTDESFQKLDNEEINYLVSLDAGTLYTKAAKCCDAVVAKFSSEVDTRQGNMSLALSQMLDHYRELASSLRNQAAVNGAMVPWAGGISESDMETYEDDTDIVQPAFKIGLLDLPLTAADVEE